MYKRQDTLWRLCRKLIHEKSDGLVLSGTTGESPNLTKEDRRIIYSTAKDSVGDKAKIIAGTGTYSTKESIEYTKMANDLGVDGIMIVTPYYSKPSQIGILQHFDQISKNTDLPIMAYNIPGRTATLIEIDTLEKLVDDIGIHSIKDAVGDLNFSKTELEVLKDKVDIYSGNDGETIEFMKMGGKGVVSVASHLVGNEIFDLINHVLNDEIESAEQLQTQLLPFFDLLFEEPSPGPVKYLLTETWEDVGSPLMPITNVSDDLASKLLENFKKIKNN